MYKSGPDLFIEEWISGQKHKENKNMEIPGMQININPIQTITNIPECMIMHELQQVTS